MEQAFGCLKKVLLYGFFFNRKYANINGNTALQTTNNGNYNLNGSDCELIVKITVIISHTEQKQLFHLSLLPNLQQKVQY